MASELLSLKMRYVLWCTISLEKYFGLQGFWPTSVSSPLCLITSPMLCYFILWIKNSSKYYAHYILHLLDLSNCNHCLQFGEVDIDGSLVASHSSVAEDIVMVNNGCLCCTVRGDLVKMLLELVKKKRDKFDHIVIETTGILFMFSLVIVSHDPLTESSTKKLLYYNWLP